MSRLLLLLALLMALMGLPGPAAWCFLLAGGAACGWVLFGPGGRWL